MTMERRIKRSDELYKALTHQLDAVRRDYAVEHLTLANQDGFLMVSSGEDDTAMWLAEVAPDVGPGWLNDDAGLLAVVDLDVHGQKLFIAGIGDVSPSIHRGLEHARRGVQRIFGDAPP